MKKIVSIFAILFVATPAIAVDLVAKNGWGSWETTNAIRSFDHNSENFTIKESLVDMHGKAHTGDEVIAFVAKKINSRGGCFIPANIYCEHGSGFRWKATIRYYAPGNASNGDCVWLCADGYAGQDCLSESQSSSVENWWGLDSTKREAMTFLKNKDIEPGMKAFDSWRGDDKADGNVILGIVDFYAHGVKASPVMISCIGDRVGWQSFHGRNAMRKMLGDSKLLCPSGYQPNPAGTDCMTVVGSGVDSSNSKTPKTTEPAPNGSAVTYSGDATLTLINALKSKPGYDAAIHSVYNYAQDENNPKYGIFCKDTSLGLKSANTLECEPCTADMRSGVCLQNNPAFGLCSKCGVGQVYNTEKCWCESAMTYSMNDMAFGKGNQSTGSVNTCWALDDDEAYRECVKTGEIQSDK